MLNGVAVTEDFGGDDEDEADGTEEDAWAMDGGDDVVEGGQDDWAYLADVEEGKEGDEVYGVEDGLLHKAVLN